MRDRDCVEFLQWALPRLGMRWAGFRKVRRQVCRRIARRLAELGLPDLDDYRLYLRRDPREWDALDPLCRVTISRFFRDRGVFAALEEVVLPELATRATAARRAALRVWSAGCASGEEPHSLSIVWAFSLAPRHPRLGLEITATDADAHLLQRAREARYPAGTLREVPAAWRRRAFVASGELLALREPLAARPSFRREDLRRTAPPGPFDLVLCRNLAFTYYAERLQEEVLGRLAGVLAPGGCLVIGAHEELPGVHRGFGPWPEAPSCWRRLADPL